MRDGYLLTSGGTTLKRTAIGPGHGGAECDEFPLCEHFMNFEVQVGKGSAQHDDDLFEVCGKVRSQGFLVIYSFWNQRLIDDCKIPFIKGTFHKMPNVSFVHFRCHSFPPLIVVMLYLISI